MNPEEKFALSQTMLAQNALIELLIGRGIITKPDFEAALDAEVQRLNEGKKT